MKYVLRPEVAWWFLQPTNFTKSSENPQVKPPSWCIFPPLSWILMCNSPCLILEYTFISQIPMKSPSNPHGNMDNSLKSPMLQLNLSTFSTFFPTLAPHSQPTHRTLLGFQVDAAQRRRRLLASREDGQSGGSHKGPGADGCHRLSCGFLYFL